MNLKSKVEKNESKKEVARLHQLVVAECHYQNLNALPGEIAKVWPSFFIPDYQVTFTAHGNIRLNFTDWWSKWINHHLLLHFLCVFMKY